MIRIHSSFHKCLTLFYLRVMGTLYNRLRPGSKCFEHYESIQGLFYNNLQKHRVVSVNGFAVDITRLNANVPASMPAGVSYAEYLTGLSVEDGLLAEIEFRKFHLESLREWPQDERIRVYRYEDILGNEAAVFADIFRFYELSGLEGRLASWLAAYYAHNRRRDDTHIRDPRPGQWREVFTPWVESYFSARYADTVSLLGY